MTSSTIVAGRKKSTPLWQLAGVVVLLAVAVGGAAQVGKLALLAVVALMQVALLIGGLAIAEPPSPRGVIAIGLGTAVAADAFAAFGSSTLSPLAGVLAVSVLASVVVQLSRGVARARMTEAIAACMSVAVGAVSAATLLVLVRQHGGAEQVTAAALAATVAVLTARCVDRVLPVPHVADGLEQGGLGIILGSMAGTAATVFYASTGTTLTPQSGALLGWAVALVAVLTDLAASYALLAAPSRPPYAFAAGPLAALAAAAPVAYVLGLLVVG
ncbi:MAG: hypothetical protein WCB04_13420 [Mycobacteriales bacterium]